MSTPRTPQQNGVVERRNKTLIDCARDLMIQKDIPYIFGREAISTTVYTLNRIQVKKGTNKTPYELWCGYSPNVCYFKVFGSRCYIKRDEYTRKFYPKSDEGTFLGYSTKSKAYQFLNKRTGKIVESANVRVDEYSEKNEQDSNSEPKKYKGFKYNVLMEPTKKDPIEVANVESYEVEPTQLVEKAPISELVLAKYVRNNHFVENIIDDKDARVLTRRRIRENACMLSIFEPKTSKEALKDDDWVKSMEEELEKIEKNDTWTLVPRAENKNVIGTKQD